MNIMTSTPKTPNRPSSIVLIFVACTVAALLALAVPARAATVTETFDSYTNGTVLTTIGGGGVWTIGANTVIDAGGVAGTKGLGSSGTIFNWKGQPFQWNTLATGTKLAMSLDFQSDATAKFDDDRVGWTITPDASTSTGSQLALQLDNNQEGGMVLYHNSTRTPALNALSGIKASTWYRFSVEFTKLTDTSAAIVGTLTELDATGNPTGTPYVGTIADTSTFSNPPSTALFTATQQCPSFKNYNAIVGNADNATFTITPPPPPPTVTLSLTGSPMAEAGGVATVTATLSAAYTQPVTVNLAFSGTATLTTDYTRSATNIVITAGSTNGSITLTAVQDTVYENPNETIVVDIDTVVNGTESGTQQVTATITNDDPVPGGITLLNENFDSMGSAGTAPPTGCAIGYLAGNPSRVVMSPYGGDGLAITALPPLLVSDGVFATQPTTATGFNFGSTGSSERALGSFPRTTTYGDHVMQIAVVNTTAGSLSSVDVSYAGEQWRQCQGTSSSGPEMLRFLASTTSPTTGFSNYSSLDFTAPKQGPADIALDGNLAANRAVLAGTIRFASAVPAGGTFYLRWHDWNDNATYDHFLAIDDVIVSTTAEPPPTPTVTLALTGSPMAEAGGVATVTATLSATSSQDVTVNLAFSGTATLTTDYTRSATNIVITAGSTNGSITLTAVQDTLYENPNETIVVDIDTVVNGTESGTQQVTAIITGDDLAPNYRSYTGVAIAENFDGLGTNGTSLTPLIGWDAGQFNPVQANQPGPGNGIATVTDTSLIVDDGTIFLANATASIGNLGTTGSGDRALGAMPKTASGDMFYQLAIKNDSGSPLASFVLSYTGEQWVNANNPSTPIDYLSVWFSDSNPTNGYVSMGSGFTFTALKSSSTGAVLDGNAPGNRTAISGIFTPAIPIAPGNVFYIRWYDRNDAAQDHVLAIDDLTVGPAMRPLVTITNPVNNATVAVGAPITVEATASDPDGTVTNVAFYADGALLSSDATAPYSYTWTTAAPGAHALTAVAWDNMGLSSTSTVVNITAGSQQVQYVIVISVDGLGGTYLNKIYNGTATGGPYTLTNFNRLRNEGAGTLAAHCDNNNWETLPNHTSIVTARPQILGTNGHNWTLNSDPAVGQTIHSVRGFYVSSVFDVAHDNGLRTGMYANKSKFSLFDTTASYPGGGSYNATYGALDTIGVDNGRDKIDNTYINTTLGGIIVNTFIAQQKTTSSNQYAFIHINEPDANGHGSGWGSATWNSSVVTVDGMLGKIFKLIEQEVPTMIGHTVVILTADHGNQDNPVTGADRYMVPFYVWGPGVAAGTDLYALNLSNRKVATTYPMTTYSGIQPIRNAEANNLALEFLGLGPIPGSVFGFAQDLAVNGIGPLQPPMVTITNPVNNASIIVGAAIPVEASASDSDGTVTNVVFYADGSLLGSDATAPYSYTWTTAALGAHTLSAIAWDNTGLSTTSAVVNITVTAPPPYRSYTSAPIAENFDALGSAGTSLALLIGWNAGHFSPSIQQGTTGGSGVATVTDPVVVDNGSHDPGGTPMIANFGTTGSADRALGSFARTTPAGDQFLQLAIRNDATNPIASFTLSYRGEEWRSCNAAAQAVTMWYSTDPVSGFVSMGSGFTLNSPNNSGSNVAIDGNASGNYTLISGTYVPAIPIPSGSIFYLRWYDINDNGIADDFFAVDDVVVMPTTSSAALPPVVTLTNPVNSVTFSLGAPIVIQASASDSDGTVTNVDFFADGTLLGNDATAPYSYTWTTAALGAHVLKVVAWDSTGLSATSTVVNITVSALITRTAYNDCSPSTSSPANTTQYRGDPTVTGPLKDFDTGSLWSANLSVVSAICTYGGTGGPMPANGSDAYNTFNGKVVFDNVCYYNTANSGWWMEARFTGLDPAKQYEFATSVNRGGSASDYASRFTKFTISGQDSAIQSSTTGVTVNSPNSVTFCSGINSVGYVARWTKIKCGADGAFTVRAEDGGGVGKGYAMDGLMLRESTPLPPAVAITNPTNNATFTEGESILVEATASDTDGTVTGVYFYADGNLLGNEASSPYSYRWIGAASGSHVLTAVAWDNDGLTSTSTVANITVTAPATSRSFTGAPITESFDGLGMDGTSLSLLTGWNAGHFNPYLEQGTTGGNGVTTVDDVLTVDNGSAGTAVPILANLGTTGAPDRALGSFARTSPQGDQFLQLAVKNDSGSPLTSIRLSYRGEEWRSSATPVQHLTVWFSNTDANNGFVPMGSAFTFSSPNNSGSGQLDGNASGNYILISGTYTPASPIPAGSTFYVRWYDINDNGIADDYLAIDDVTVAGPPQPPLVVITGPTNNAILPYGAPIDIQAAASDIDGAVTNVTFYADGNLLGNDNTGPAYSFTWNGAAAGPHALTAVAWDNDGLTSTSAVVNITVPAPLPPTVTITKPANNITFSAGASITIQASASDSDGTVTKVDFYADGGLLSSDATAPYSYTWATAAEGAHALTAVAWDSTGISATSSVVNITASALTTRTAYNDCSPSGSSPANATQYRGDPDGSGPLKDFDNGTLWPATLTVASAICIYGGSGGPMPATGTDAYNTFNGKVVFDNVCYYNTANSGWWMEARFTGLDPTKEYEFATSVNRGGSAGDYASRFSKFTISGHDSAIQSSTTGVTVNSTNSVTFCSGINTVGYVARWTRIKCGDDGAFTVRVEDGGGVGKGYAMDGLMLRETVPVPVPPIISGMSISTNGLFIIQGTTDVAGSLVTEKATNLVTPIYWEKIQTNAVPGGAYSITIPQGADPRAYYRVMSQ